MISLSYKEKKKKKKKKAQKNRKLVLNGYGVFFWSDKNILQLDRGGG